jgi:molecular chaperone DnaK (HSP70)
MTNVLQEAEILPAQVDEVIMVGGSTRIPFLRSKISNFFHGKVIS